MIPSHDNYLHTKNLRYWLIPSSDIVNQIALQSNWMKGAPGHTQPKVEVSDATFDN